MIKNILFFGVIFLLLGFAAFSYTLPDYLQKKLEDDVKEGCTGCELKIGQLEMDLIHFKVNAHSVWFHNNLKDSTEVKIFCKDIFIEGDSSILNGDVYHISKLTLRDLDVKIIERHEEFPKRPNPKELEKLEASYGGKLFESLPPANIDLIEIKNSKLKYSYKIFNKEAIIRVGKINGSVSELSTRKDIGPRYTKAEVKAQLQDSGIIDLTVKADLYSIKNEDVINLTVENQKMPELDSFFEIEDGIRMDGILHMAKGEVHLSQGHSTGYLRASYDGLVLHFISTPERGKFKSAISDFLAKAKIAKRKPAKNKPPPEAKVDYKREPEQSVIKYILFGFKEAAMKVISN